MPLFESLRGVPDGPGIAHVVDDPGLGKTRKKIFEISDVTGPLVADHADAAASREVSEGGLHGLPKTRCSVRAVSSQSTQGSSEERLRLGVPHPRPASYVRFRKAMNSPLIRIGVKNAGPRAGPKGVALPEACDLGVLIEHASQQCGPRFFAPDTEEKHCFKFSRLQ